MDRQKKPRRRRKPQPDSDLKLALAAISDGDFSKRKAGKLQKALGDFLAVVADRPAIFSGYYKLMLAERKRQGVGDGMTETEYLCFCRDLMQAAAELAEDKGP